MKISIVIPTLNEADRIFNTVRHLIIHGGSDVSEVTVVDSHLSSDNTSQLAMSAGAKLLSGKRSGRAKQMNNGAAIANSEILYFVHADTNPPKTFAQDILRSVGNGKSFGFFSYQSDSPSKWLKINAWFTKYDGLFAGGGDQSLYITKNSFYQLDGYCEAYCIMEDFNIVKRAKMKNMEYEIIDNDVLVSARKYEKNSYLKVNLVNLYIFILYGMGVRPKYLKRSYQRLLN